jgi:S1-C subfamily serine protease
MKQVGSSSRAGQAWAAWLLGIPLALGLAAGFPAATAADPPATRAIAEHVLAATVGIDSSTADGGSFSGSGSVITPAGHILTSTSVVPADAAEIRVTFPGFVLRPATLVASDPALSVSLIRVDAEGLACLPVAREVPAVGAIAYTASDVDQVLLTNGRASFSRGLISGRYAVAKQGESAYEGTVIETTAAVNPGSDGGPLVAADGRLCGVISLGVSPLRWQGVAVPTAVLLDRFPPLAGGDLPIASEPPVGLAADPATLAAVGHAADLERAARSLAAFLVGIEVSRQHPPEVLPRVSWEAHRAGIANWSELSDRQRAERFAAFAATARTLEVNQLLRRPAGEVTGLLVSPDGHVLTSLFNVGPDIAFLAKATGRPRAFDPDEPAEKLLADPPGGLARQPNRITSLTVVLPDGSRHQAEIVARHEPLGVALLKIAASDLGWFDLAAAGTSPLLGDAVAVVGRSPAGDGFTLNSGIVSAAARLRGYQFQTDALLNYGNSGGPVVDAMGNFLGIATAPIEPDTVLGRLFGRSRLMRWTRAPNSGVGMVARADRLAAAVEAMREGRSFDRIPGPFLGVQADMSRAFGEDVVIGGVVSGSPAERAGLTKGDRLLEFGGVELHTWRDLTERVAASSAGDTITLLVQRPSRGPRLVIAGRDVETLEDLRRLKRSLRPGDTFEGTLTTDDTREVAIVLEENR